MTQRFALPLSPGTPVELERWFAAQGGPPRYDLARSGATALSLGDVLDLAPEASEAFRGVSLDYGDGRGGAAVREAVAASGMARSAADVLMTHGAVEALLLCCAILTAQRKRVLVASPCYEGLMRTPAAVGAEITKVSVLSKDGCGLDLGELIARVDDTVGAVILNTPANPTGAVATSTAIGDLAAACTRNGATLVVDEVSVKTLDASARSVSTAPWFAESSVIAVGDLSKACGLGGLRIGWMTTAVPALLDAAAALKDVTTLGNSPVDELLATRVLHHRNSVVGRVREAALDNLATLSAWVERTDGARMVTPTDGLVSFPFIPGLEGTEAIDHLRENYDVAVVPGHLFGAVGHVRIGLGVDHRDFVEALARIDTVAGGRDGLTNSTGHARVRA